MKKIVSLFAVLVLAISCATGAGRTSTKGVSDMRIEISVTSDTGAHSLTATLADNKSAEAFYSLLQKDAVTVKMHDYGSFEKVGPLGTTLPRSDRQITTSAGDIILYQGNQITIYYDTNSWNFTRLGKVDGVTQAELKKILGKGNVTAVFSVME